MKMGSRNRPRSHRNSWSASGNVRRLKQPKGDGLPAWLYAAAGLSLGAVLSSALFLWPSLNAVTAAEPAPSVQRSFSLCETGGGTNCVVDGDTIWLDGSKIRIADIDAPETHQPRCGAELERGKKATRKLLELVNAGPFEVKSGGNRDRDKYGRLLRILERSGNSLGDILVEEGLARAWDGARHPWC